MWVSWEMMPCAINFSCNTGPYRLFLAHLSLLKQGTNWQSVGQRYSLSRTGILCDHFPPEAAGNTVVAKMSIHVIAFSKSSSDLPKICKTEVFFCRNMLAYLQDIFLAL